MTLTSKNSFLFCMMLIASCLLYINCKKEDKFPSQTLPKITVVNPLGALPGATVTIKGLHLTAVTGVRFGAIEAIFNVLSDTSVQALVPDSIPVGNTYVQVYIGDGKAYDALKFTVLEAPKIPAITSVNPATAFPGDVITIRGINFKNVSVVSFGNIIADYTIADSTKLLVTIPANLTDANQTITVSAPTGSTVIHFNVNLAPLITSFTPGKAKIGDTVMVIGFRFNGTTTVTLGTLTTTYNILNDSTLAFTVPAAAASNNITITTPEGTAASATSLIVY